MVDTTPRAGQFDGGTTEGGFGSDGRSRGGLAWLTDRQLPHYPDDRTRSRYLAITVLATIVLYYELYVGGSVATKVIAEYGFTFTQFILVLVIGNAVGACASLFAGLADRWGRANLVVGGLLLTGLLIGLGIPHAPNKITYAVMFGLVSVVEGMVLVATPALIRDFSPQVGRGAAMGFWTLGPVLGSLVVTVVSSHTLTAHPNWRFQFYVCGIVGLVVFVVALIGLKELSPSLRDQLMVSLKDRALIEARAAGLDPEKALQGSWRQMLRLDVVGPAFAIAVFLLLYYVLVAFLVVYFVTVFGYTEQKANSLANWYWIANAIALVTTGLLSDKLRVRKPLMIVGAVIALISTALFAKVSTNLETSYYTFALVFVVGALGGGMAYVAWMAGFTETVERHNPAATATGLAIWGWIIRVVVTVSYAALILVVPATSTLVDHGPRALDIAAKYPDQVATLGAVDTPTLLALQASPSSPPPAALNKAIAELQGAGLATSPTAAINRLLQLQKSPIPADDLQFLQKNGAQVKQAQKDNPKQWQHWWLICLAAQALFLPFVFLMAGRWSPRRAREDELEHEQLVEREMQALRAG
ncbi:MAG TPA: MFS transporter [Frankiaceae bacterium]|nr:MFS transporter [Frankiaceae bacterium]